MKNQICTILGGGGFIGRYLVRNLTKKNYRCIITTRKAFQKGYIKTQATPGAIELLDWNPNNFSDLKEAINIGTAHGALAMTAPGDTSMVSIDEVKSLIKNPSARVSR